MTWEGLQRHYAAIRSDWGRRMRAAWDRAQPLADALTSDEIDTGAILARARSSVDLLQRAERNAKRIEARIAALRGAGVDVGELGDEAQELREEIDDLRAGLLVDATPREDDAAVRGPPLLAIGLITLGVAGIAWAYTAYPYAQAAYQDSVNLGRDLELRAEASAAGRTLPPSTLRPPGQPASKVPAAALVAVGVLVAGGLAWWASSRGASWI